MIGEEGAKMSGDTLREMMPGVLVSLGERKARHDTIVKLLKDHIAVTLSHVVQKCWFAPDECGAIIKSMLASDNIETIVSLGAALNLSLEQESWKPLADIKKIVEKAEEQK